MNTTNNNNNNNNNTTTNDDHTPPPPLPHRQTDTHARACTHRILELGAASAPMYGTTQLRSRFLCALEWLAACLVFLLAVPSRGWETCLCRNICMLS
mmetsp:Transcript_991/g.2265  ORF Transcript_991/g.2265 Transcript_991/m.2265 type:complete len:97 (-) Transcript_991:330-620(-)